MENIFITDYLRSEQEKMGWFDKLVRNNPTSVRTSAISTTFEKIKSGEETILRPSLLYKIFLFPVIVFSSIVAFNLIFSFLNHTIAWLPFLAGFSFLSFIIYLFVWHGFLNPKHNYEIKMNSKFIHVAKKTFYWAEVAETCILTKMKGRYTNSCLIIFGNNFVAEKFNLSNFSIRDKQLASIIEFYRGNSIK